METVTFNVPSITCSNCSNKIQSALGSMQGVNNVAIDLKTQSVQVEYNPDTINPQEIKKEITTMGYEVI
ncbi:MAG TPA: heavy-metal-associated domain-containing protein [Clostridiaceae bacterium]|nr:heavy-metal-associated domain-containing protein [Clostridiaceae bacterium]